MSIFTHLLVAINHPYIQCREHYCGPESIAIAFYVFHFHMIPTHKSIHIETAIIFICLFSIGQSKVMTALK